MTRSQNHIFNCMNEKYYSCLNDFLAAVQEYSELEIPSDVAEWLEEEVSSNGYKWHGNYGKFILNLLSIFPYQVSGYEDSKYLFLTELVKCIYEDTVDIQELRARFKEHQVALQESFDTFMTKLSNHLGAAIEKRDSKI
mmetsp:Transcript_18545/g.30905  ORF Transcript_18545/g.30905 Transcript_18545/m.30905 type:complete len:139 (+) Transcript_18545:674-1090(+)